MTTNKKKSYRTYVWCISLILTIIFIFPIVVLAHCPLCTLAAGATAVGAMWLGINTFSIGIFIGAFATALGLWVARIVKWKLPYKSALFLVISFLTTVLPIKSLMPGYFSYYLHWGGEYGSILNRTYILSHFLVGGILGVVLLLVAPKFSLSVSQRRKNKTLPYQGVTITLLLLLSAALITELIL